MDHNELGNLDIMWYIVLVEDLTEQCGWHSRRYADAWVEHVMSGLLGLSGAMAAFIRLLFVKLEVTVTLNRRE